MSVFGLALARILKRTCHRQASRLAPEQFQQRNPPLRVGEPRLSSTKYLEQPWLKLGWQQPKFWEQTEEHLELLDIQHDHPPFICDCT